MSIRSTVDFVIDSKGDVTNTQVTGTFTAKTKLSMKEILRQDELYRQILGVNSQEASEHSKDIASALSYLATHIIGCPDIWKALENGMKCEDLNIIADINNRCREEIDKEYKKLSEEASAAETILKTPPAV